MKFIKLYAPFSTFFVFNVPWVSVFNEISNITLKHLFVQCCATKDYSFKKGKMSKLCTGTYNEDRFI